MSEFVIPSAYGRGYRQARERNWEVADTYIKNTTVGDAALDPVMAELKRMPQKDLQKYIRAHIERDDRLTMRAAPQVLRDFFAAVQEPPEWVDFEAFAPAGRAFFKNMTNMLVAYAVGSAVEGFSTLVAKSFSITGRVTKLDGGATRRLRQNNRHMVEVYYPDGLRRGGDGWKVTMRIRFIHARVRQMLAVSADWDSEAWGMPLSMAHIGGISLYTFSIRQFEHAIAMGAKISKAERDSIVQVWRYVGHIFGVPQDILFTSEREARELYHTGHLCEPPPGDDCRDVANTVFKAIPIMSGLADERARKGMEMYAYRLSRALIGNKLADTLGYPKTFPIAWLVLLYYRQREVVRRLLMGRRLAREEAFFQIFDNTQYDDTGISYKMPDHVHASRSSPW